MRSRYSAFVLGLGDYLVHSWHPAYLGELSAADLSVTDTEWDGLTIIESAEAWFRLDGERHALHERAYFVPYQGRWVYTDGDPDPAPWSPRPNQRCWCGSGKKYKICCS
jgi:SEC-C motif-containing protein